MTRLVVLGAVMLGVLGTISHSGSKIVAGQNSGRDILLLQLEEQIPVPGVAGRIDHFSADTIQNALLSPCRGRFRTRSATKLWIRRQNKMLA